MAGSSGYFVSQSVTVSGNVSFSVTIGSGGSVSISDNQNIYSFQFSQFRAVIMMDIQQLLSWMDRPTLQMEAEGKIS